MCVFRHLVDVTVQLATTNPQKDKRNVTETCRGKQSQETAVSIKAGVALQTELN